MIRPKLFLKRAITWKKPSWLAIVTLALVFVAFVECVTIGGIYLKSRRQAGAMAYVTKSPEETSLHGVTLYGSGRNFTVDNTFLMKLSELHDQGVTVIRIPIDITSHIVGSGSDLSIDAQWLGQTASIMEMIFQSNYKVILSATMPNTITSDTYVAIWTQIDQAFGHRPESEMWYDLMIPDGADAASWSTGLQAIITKVRETNQNRELLLTLPINIDDSTRDMIMMLFNQSRVNFGYTIAKSINDEAMLKLKRQIDLNADKVILIEPEGGMENKELSQSIVSAATYYGFGYLLQGN